MSFLVKVHESLLSKVIELSAAVLVLGIIMGYVALPIFFTVSTSGWGATNILIWGVVVTVALASVIMLFIRMFQHGTAE